MIHYLRDDKNKTIIECDVHTNNIRSYLSIPEYSQLLLKSDNPNILILDLDELDNLRRIWFEGSQDDYPSIDKFVTEYYSRVAKKYNLIYITQK
jgi:hypothetical protein